MDNTLNTDKEYPEYEKMFANITGISFSDCIAPFSDDESEIAISEENHHKDEIVYLQNGIIGPFTRTMVIRLPLEVHTQEGKHITVHCKLRSRTIQNLINDDIVQNISSAGSIDLLDIDFEFFIGSMMAELSEYHVGDEKFYINIKKHVISFIKEHPIIEKTIVKNYCDGLKATLSYIKSKEELITQRKETTRDLFVALGMPKAFPLSEKNETVTSDSLFLAFSSHEYDILSDLEKKEFNEKYDKLIEIKDNLMGFDAAYQIKGYIKDIKKNDEELQKIIEAIKDGEVDIRLDSKFFFLDNGDYLYDDVIEDSIYNETYKKEIELIQNNQGEIKPYIRNHYIGLGCGKGKKDYATIADHIDTYSSANYPSISNDTEQKIQKVLLMDSSLKALSQAEKLINKGKGKRGGFFGTTTVIFSQERINKFIEGNSVKTLSSVRQNPKEGEFNVPDIRESPNMFTLFGGTFGNFRDYKKKFLQEMHILMNEGDILCLSLFNPLQSKAERENAVSIYDTSKMYAFLKNFFIKLGIPRDAIEIKVGYDGDHTIIMDARIHRNNNQPVYISSGGEKVMVQDGTIFHCVGSERLGEQDLQECIDQSETSLKIVDKITEPGNPFTLYMLSK